MAKSPDMRVNGDREQKGPLFSDARSLKGRDMYDTQTGEVGKTIDPDALPRSGRYGK